MNDEKERRILEKSYQKKNNNKKATKKKKKTKHSTDTNKNYKKVHSAVIHIFQKNNIYIYIYNREDREKENSHQTAWDSARPCDEWQET